MRLHKAPETPKPQILSHKEEQILEALRVFDCATARDITRLLSGEGALTHTRAIMARLSGGKDYMDREYLYRFPLPSTLKGNKTRVYTLGAKAREMLNIESYYRPYKFRHLSYSHLWHHLALVRLVCSAHVWCREQQEPDVRLVETRLSHDLAREPGKAASKPRGTTASVPVVPDAFLNFDVLRNDTHAYYVPLLVELDRGSEYRVRFQQHVQDRIDFIRSGEYARFFGVEAVRIAYATTGDRPEFRQSRLTAMRAWAHEVLIDLELEDWASVFYFTTLVYEDIYNLKHFSDPVWYSPGDPTPKRLLAP